MCWWVWCNCISANNELNGTRFLVSKKIRLEVRNEAGALHPKAQKGSLVIQLNIWGADGLLHVMFNFCVHVYVCVYLR